MKLANLSPSSQVCKLEYLPKICMFHSGAPKTLCISLSKTFFKHIHINNLCIHVYILTSFAVIEASMHSQLEKLDVM